MRKDWVKIKLGDILEIERGGSPRPIKEYITTEADGINWIKIGDTKNSNKYITKTYQKIKPSGLKKTRLVYPGDFVLSNSMSFGRPFIMGIKGAIHDGWLVLRDKNQILDKNFLYHILSSPFVFNQFSKLAKGSTVKNLNIDLVSEVEINLVSKSEQYAIVAKIEELFSDLDKGVTDLKKAQDQLKIYRQAVLKKAFEGEYSENVKIELNRIGDHCKIVSGKAFKKSEYSDDGVRLFQIANVSFNKIVWNKIAHLPKSYLSEEKLKDLVLKEGDLVMALNRPMLNNELKIGILGKSDVPSILYQRVGKFVYDSRINSKYLGYFLQSPVFIKWLSKELQGVNIPFINQSNLLGFSEFPYMDIESQNQTVQEIESRLSVCDKVDESISVSLEKTKPLRQSILKKAFEGNLLTTQEIEKCKSEPDYEPAAVLLEKIKNL